LTWRLWKKPGREIEGLEKYLHSMAFQDPNIIFLYKPNSRELIMAPQQQGDYDRIAAKLGEVLKDPGTCKLLVNSWQLFVYNNKPPAKPG
jgi:hypothetical protein